MANSKFWYFVKWAKISFVTGRRSLQAFALAEELNIFVFNYDNPSDLQNVNVNNNNLNYINIYNSIININQNNDNNNNSYNNLNNNNDYINISYNNDKYNANNNIFNTIFGKTNTQADSHHFKNFSSNDII